MSVELEELTEVSLHRPPSNRTCSKPRIMTSKVMKISPDEMRVVTIPAFLLIDKEVTETLEAMAITASVEGVVTGEVVEAMEEVVEAVGVVDCSTPTATLTNTEAHFMNIQQPQ